MVGWKGRGGGGRRRAGRSQGTVHRFTVGRRLAEVHQLGRGDELGTDGAIVLVGAAGLGVGPREAAADGGVVRLCVDGAHFFFFEYAAPPAHPRSSLPPPSTV